MTAEFTLEALKAAIRIQAEIANNQRVIMLDQSNRIVRLEKRVDAIVSHCEDIVSALSIASETIQTNAGNIDYIIKTL
tara:strand:+ start:1081 stop:1314 length:234 start_codon:yes stop_codon:yes gene_type:complete